MKNDTVTIVLPSYKPDEKLISTVKGLCAEGFDDIIVVDDGGGSATAEIFNGLAAMNECTVLTHEENRGKGAALKTAFAWYIKNRSGAGVVTADGDGQHTPRDIRRVAQAMLESGRIVLGARDFSLPDVPERSRKGNRITSGVFKTFVGMRISDTQTGLRGIPASCLSGLMTVYGDRYEYETNVLLYMKRNRLDFEEITISTVYINENETSHFRPVRDSARIYALILKYIFTGAFIKFICSSGISFLIDIGAYTAFVWLLSHYTAVGAAAAGIGYAAARIISSFVNYMINRRIFKGGSVKRTIVRYYILAACILGLGIAGVSLLTQLLWSIAPVAEFFNAMPPSRAETMTAVLVKLPVDMLLFIASYNIQKNFVFKKEDTAGGR